MSKIKVYATVKAFTGVRAGVAFLNGVGECDNPNMLTWFKARGYTVEAEQEAASKSGSKALSKMNRAELVAYVAEKGIEVDTSGTKAVIRAAIEAAEAANDGEEKSADE